MLRFLNSTPARLATLLLVAQAALLYSSIRPEAISTIAPNSATPVRSSARPGISPRNIAR